MVLKFFNFGDLVESGVCRLGIKELVFLKTDEKAKRQSLKKS